MPQMFFTSITVERARELLEAGREYARLFHLPEQSSADKARMTEIIARNNVSEGDLLEISRVSMLLLSS